MNFRSLSVEVGRIFRFGVVGICATMVYILASIIANEISRIPPVPASILAQVAAIGVSYFGHSAYSFQVKADHRAFLWRFLVIAGLNFVVATAVTWLIADIAKFSPRVGIAAVAILIPIINYICNRFWVFMPGLAPATLAQPVNSRLGHD
jgi:putative flippase GtrA